jgi:hypothetical protein
VSRAELQRLRRRILVPDLTDTQRNFRAFEYLNAVGRAPFLTLAASHFFDGVSRAGRRQIRAALRALLAAIDRGEL